MLFGKIKHLSALDRVLESLAAAGFCISAFKSSLDFLRIVMCFEEEDEVMGVYFPNELVVPTNQFFKKKKKNPKRLKRTEMEMCLPTLFL